MYSFLSRELDTSDNQFTKKRWQFNTDTSFSRTIQFNIFRTIETDITQIYAQKDIMKYTKVLFMLYEYANYQRTEGEQNQAIRAYEYFMHESNQKGMYFNGFREFHESLDYTEIYYNIAFLYHELGNFEKGMHNFAKADEEHSKRNKVEIGQLLVGMIDKKGTPFWNFSNHLCLNCGGYDSFGKPFSYQALFGKKFEVKEVRLLLDDMPLILKLQFVLSVEEFWNVYSYSYNIMKGLRVNRFLGNLVWILEAYSKYKLGKELINFKIVLDELIQKHPRLYQRFNTLLHRTKNLNTNDRLITLNETIDNDQDLLNKKAACFVVAYQFRNHTAHNLTEEFLLFKDSAYNKRIFCCILWAFFITCNDFKNV
ncbi:hypothetical protein [Paenibacillus sp. MMS20-IR301]|uniref:hypothetical protein n=1 Tax=Paenibacillus sp. MMS20-IR301 TaxID=2895946 RepID=UPI0028E8F440|nr:hypothetical protein [Paenibacillus sp. MMS20-IR301]WNS41577.1 hypothetical protein LOS79_21450 [Paenibacillus sp. MMS20-IR301]